MLSYRFPRPRRLHGPGEAGAARGLLLHADDKGIPFSGGPEGVRAHDEKAPA
ncbi:hypothetical protein [Streptomyces sp. MN13]